MKAVLVDNSKRYEVVDVATGDVFGAVNGVPYWEAANRAQAMARNWCHKKRFEVRELSR